MSERYTTCVLANICMIEDNKGNVLVQERKKKDWPGLTFPGGHVEENETLEEAVIREIKEETGLLLKKVVFCGIMEWPWENGARYLGLVYKSRDFEGKLKSSEEENVFWMKKSEIFQHPTSLDLDKIFAIMEERPYEKTA